ncbi:imidazole glycerol phosphate synthase subunit HisH [Parasphingopyxis algicola]|uniref:imidazole glycerol phosphate synthase subunit HisH n=1 Tax=Parasphingopyxis algicola TaxID=2026624 RepID=UPI0015A1855D|nr:imidazole glycerol phosphate synthase subunit HisH [Parasphingopyxis algicola]QLC25784.1 imidazole glycerol phosphate synthase subunit HisH [Parasphingopyxis algicola]
MGERIALIDYGAGNLRSVHNALMAAGAEAIDVTAEAEAVRDADRIVLPGVGAFAACMDGLSALPGMVEALHSAAIDKARPFLGICVGMQLMAERGEEHGTHQGLGWIAGTVQPLASDDPRLKIPHMGWNDVTPQGEPPLIEPGEAYFLHGYHVALTDAADAYAMTDHGGPVTAAIGRDTMIGVQFHPEKSQGYGLSFLRRFLDWRP